MNFMDDAFAALRRYQACDGHAWRKPSETTRSDGYGRHRTVMAVYETSCKKCGLIASRPTLERLNQEIIAS